MVTHNKFVDSTKLNRSHVHAKVVPNKCWRNPAHLLEVFVMTGCMLVHNTLQYTTVERRLHTYMYMGDANTNMHTYRLSVVYRHTLAIYILSPLTHTSTSICTYNNCRGNITMLDTRLHRQQPQDIDQEGLRYGGHFYLSGCGRYYSCYVRVNSIFNNSIFLICDSKFLRFLHHFSVY